ncbi:hypothetical protein [Leptospira sp. mild_001]|uniref:hypothetical protein n=1 Tax=Leptospira sp. mild_001 TaxID=2838238 RepID=UPI001E2CB387|nr:hypothetical protein [Leptospira sp. mild_001]
MTPSIQEYHTSTCLTSSEIQGKQEKRFRIATTDSNHGNRVAPDLVQRNFKPTIQEYHTSTCLTSKNHTNL